MRYNVVTISSSIRKTYACLYDEHFKSVSDLLADCRKTTFMRFLKCAHCRAVNLEISFFAQSNRAKQTSIKGAYTDDWIDLPGVEKCFHPFQDQGHMRKKGQGEA